MLEDQEGTGREGLITAKILSASLRSAERNGAEKGKGARLPQVRRDREEGETGGGGPSLTACHVEFRVSTKSSIGRLGEWWQGKGGALWQRREEWFRFVRFRNIL